MLAHVGLAATVELDDASRSGRAVGGELLVVDGPRGRDVEDPPAGVADALLEVHLLRVDEEVGIQVADLLGRLAPHEHRARLDPADLAWPAAFGAAALSHQPAMKEERLGEGRAGPGKPPRAGDWNPAGVHELSARDGGLRVGIERVEERSRRAVSDLGVLVQEQAEAPPSLPKEECVVLREPRAALAGDQTNLRKSCRATASAEPSSEALSSTRISCSSPAGCGAGDRLQAAEQELAPVGVHHAVGKLHRHNPRGCGSRSSIRRRTRRPTTGRSARRPRPRRGRRRACHQQVRPRPRAARGGLPRVGGLLPALRRTSRRGSSEARAQGRGARQRT